MSELEAVARALCRHTWGSEFAGKNLDAYVDVHWKDHAADARAALEALASRPSPEWQPVDRAKLIELIEMYCFGNLFAEVSGAEEAADAILRHIGRVEQGASTK